ncbi:MAG TPA: hypothetical protein VNN19_01830 [bacterium]|nr:hypothetical protein [bacterium]
MAKVAWLTVVLMLAGTVAAQAYSKQLTEDDIKSAVEYGKTRRGKDIVESGSPYFLRFGPFALGYISTPWLEVASVARQAAGEYRDPTEDEIRTAISTSTGRLQIFAFVAEPLDDFWRDFHMVILQGERVVQPTLKQGRFIRAVSCTTRPCTVLAGLLAYFPDETLDTNADIEIVVILKQGRKELRTKVSLGVLR